MNTGSVTVETDNEDLVVVQDKEFDAQNSVHVNSIQIPSNFSQYSELKQRKGSPSNSRANSPMIKVSN